jgi:hypothetical protein
MPTPSALFALILSSIVGLAAFLYGKKNAAWGPALIGVALMTYPWFVEQTWLLYGVGAVLCVALYYFRE